MYRSVKRALNYINPFKKEKKRGFYEGGRKTKANLDFWNATSPFETTASADRDTMRGRSRWLASNNPIMSNIDDAIINNTVGRGIGLQSKTGNKNLDDEIEKRWKIWMGECDIRGISHFFDLQKMNLRSRMVDGEIYTYKKITKDGLRLQTIEADSIDVNSGEKGITIDKDGRPLKYHFLTEKGTIDVNAEDVINYFKIERPTQYRGVTEYKQAILDIKNFSAYQTATVKSARANAEIAYTVETERNSTDFNVNDSTGEELEEINGLMVYYLKQGEKVSKHDNKHSGSGYADFILTTVRMIATARKISYELAFRDYSKVNFASSRASLIQDNKRFDEEQTHLTTYYLDDIFEAWMEVEILRGMLPINAATWKKDKAQFLAPRWAYPKREWVDPDKTMKAIERAIRLNQTTESAEVASAGGDFEEIIQTKAKEIEILKANKMYIEPIAEEKSEKDSLRNENFMDSLREMIEETFERSINVG